MLQDSPTTLRARLRDETSALHRAAEDAMGRHGPFTEPLGRAHFLDVMHRAHLEHHAALDRASVILGLPRRSHVLLASFGTDDEAAPSPSPAPDDVACLGTAYVFEGSALGAGVLIKQCRRADVAPPPYLLALTAGVATRWPVFVRRIDDHEAHADEIVAGAQATFTRLVELAGA